MKISISLMLGNAMGSDNWLEIAKSVKQAGFDGIDLSMCVEPSEPSELERLSEYVFTQANAAKEAGLEISQCHFPYWPSHIYTPGDGSYEDFESTMLPFYQRALELCSQIGCKVGVVHPYVSFESRAGAVKCNAHILKKLLPEMERLGVSIAMENLYAFWDGHYLPCPVSDPEVIMEIIEEVGSPYVGACIDTGHANITGHDMSQMARIYGKHLLALHVNGNAGKDDHVVPYTMSDWCELMDYHAFSKALGEIGYAGSYNLEVAVGPLVPSVIQPFYNYAGAVARVLADEAV